MLSNKRSLLKQCDSKTKSGERRPVSNDDKGEEPLSIRTVNEVVRSSLSGTRPDLEMAVEVLRQLEGYKLRRMMLLKHPYFMKTLLLAANFSTPRERAETARSGELASLLRLTAQNILEKFEMLFKVPPGKSLKQIVKEEWLIYSGINSHPSLNPYYVPLRNIPFGSFLQREKEIPFGSFGEVPLEFPIQPRPILAVPDTTFEDPEGEKINVKEVGGEIENLQVPANEISNKALESDNENTGPLVLDTIAHLISFAMANKGPPIGVNKGRNRPRNQIISQIDKKLRDDIINAVQAKLDSWQRLTASKYLIAEVIASYSDFASNSLMLEWLA